MEDTPWVLLVAIMDRLHGEPTVLLQQVWARARSQWRGQNGNTSVGTVCLTASPDCTVSQDAS